MIFKAARDFAGGLFFSRGPLGSRDAFTRQTPFVPADKPLFSVGWPPACVCFTFLHVRLARRNLPPMHSLKDKTPRREGFTLIELLTVIAIIGILAAIIIPTVGRVRATAKASSCASQLRQISMALVLYQQENKGVLPAGSVGSPSIIWQKALKPYLPLKGQTDTSATHSIFTCPSAEYNGYTTDQLAHTYAGTGAIRGPGASGAPSTLGSSSSLPRRYSTIAEPSRTPWVVEGKAVSATAINCDSTYPWATASADMGASGAAATSALDFRHNDAMNAAYADGSVRRLNFPEFQTITVERWNGR